MAKITVNDTEITIVKVKNEDYLCLTDNYGEFATIKYLICLSNVEKIILGDD